MSVFNSVFGLPGSKVNYTYDKVLGVSRPTLYPSPRGVNEKWNLPDLIQSDITKLNSILEFKYTKEYLKICAFYNKMFPSLQHYSWSRSSYNVQPFTALEQERTDTGTGISRNYLKNVIDTVVSRIGNVSFEVLLKSDLPTLMYVVYKSEVERVLRSKIRSERLNKLATGVFHDAAILGFGHIFMDPWTLEWRKVTDWEMGYYESEFNKGRLKHCLLRDLAFPVSELSPYVKGCDENKLAKLIENTQQVDLKLYFDCNVHKAYVIIKSDVITEIDYPFEHVMIETFSWDMGVKRTTVTSLFDMLLPLQRSINKLDAKLTQMLANYKGPVPVFSTDADIALKAISNSTGECLYVDSPTEMSKMMTVIEPTPLDPQLSAEINDKKTVMFEIAGIQQVSMDMENYRSAAAIIALDQARDAAFQSQLTGMAEFIRDVLIMFARFEKEYNTVDTKTGIDWDDVCRLLDEAYIDIKPIHINDPLDNTKEPEPDFAQMGAMRYVVDVAKGKKTFKDLPMYFDYAAIKSLAASVIVRLGAVGEVPAPLNEFIIECFIEDVKNGEVQL
ncbi:MAG: hypothetical protein Pg6A_20150 [Termitinemataceae bacterium]|nr:MAG: hypothetical protein Pg6A_20150 [Termitinemataceae bacterium]